MAASRKAAIKARPKPKPQGPSVETMRIMWLTVIFTGLSVLFALMAYATYV